MWMLKPSEVSRCHYEFASCILYSTDQVRDSITSYLKGEPGKFEANGSHADVTPEAKAKSYFPEPQNDIGKQSIKENLKPKVHGSGRTEEPASPLAAYQKSLEETSKFVIEDAPKPCVPVSMKKMTRTSADGKARLNLHEDEGSSGSEPKVGHPQSQHAPVIANTHGLLLLTLDHWVQSSCFLNGDGGVAKESPGEDVHHGLAPLVIKGIKYLQPWPRMKKKQKNTK